MAGYVSIPVGLSRSILGRKYPWPLQTFDIEFVSSTKDTLNASLFFMNVVILEDNIKSNTLRELSGRGGLHELSTMHILE